MLTAFLGVLRSNQLLLILVLRKNIMLLPQLSRSLNGFPLFFWISVFSSVNLPLFYVIDVSALHLTSNIVFHGQTKNIEIDKSFSREMSNAEDI